MTQMYHKIIAKLNSLPAPDLNMLARIWIAIVFYNSSRTKVDGGFFTPSDTTYYLFESEYAVPLLSPEFAAHLTIYMETLLPILLIVGLFTRFSAFMLLGMTAVIQFFVYPGSWPDHLTWAVVLVLLVLRGAGAYSIDRVTIEKNKV